MERKDSGTGPRILLVEDDRDLREIVSEILEGGGYDVVAATNGQEGLDLLRESVADGQPPRLVLLDLTMPVKDGFEFITEQQQTPELAKVPVIAMSADNAITEKLAGFRTSGHLKKPVEIDALLATCARYCS